MITIDIVQERAEITKIQRFEFLNNRHGKHESSTSSNFQHVDISVGILIDFWPVPMRRPFGQRWIFLKKVPHGCG